MLVSVIIPTLNEENFIADTVRSARRAYDSGEVEIIVVDGGSQDETVNLIPPGVKIIQSQPGRAAQMNLGAEKSRGEILVFCHADTSLPPGWREAVISISRKTNVSGGTFQLSILPEEGILKLRNRINFPAYWMFMFGDQVQFMSRQIFDAIGGFPAISIMEDLEMSRSLAKSGRLVRIPLRAKTSSRRFLESKPRQQWLLSLKCVILYVFFGRTAEEIRKIYHGESQKGN